MAQQRQQQSKFGWTAFPHVNARAARFIEQPWEEMLSALEQTNGYAVKSECPLLKLARFGQKKTDKGSLRSNENIEELFGVEGDYDAGEMSLEEAAARLRSARVKCALYASPSWTQERPKWRLLAPLSVPVAGEGALAARTLFLSRINGVLGGVLAGESFTASQAFYFGYVQGGHSHPFVRVEGDYVDLRNDLNGGAIGKSPKPHSGLSGSGSSGGGGGDAAEPNSRGEWAFQERCTQLKRRLVDGDGRRDMFKRYIGERARAGVAVEGIMEEVRGLAERYVDRAHPVDLRNLEQIARDFVAGEAGVVRGDASDPIALSFDRWGVGAAQLKDATPGEAEVHPYNRYDPDLEGAPQAIEYLLDGIIEAGVVMLAGSTGAGKTTQLVPLMFRVAHLCAAEDPLRPLLQRKIIYVSEDCRQVKRIVSSMRLAGELEGCAPGTVNERFKLVEAARITPRYIVQAVDDYKNFYTQNINPETGVVFNAAPVVVFDTANASFSLENESDNAEVGAAMATLKQKFAGLPIIIVGHLAKVLKRAEISDLSARGAGAWEADANQVLYLTREEDNTRWLEVKQAKHRFVERAEGIVFGCSSNGRKVLDQLGNWVYETVLHGVPRPSAEGGLQAIKQAKEEEKQAIDEQSVGMLLTNVRKKLVKMLSGLGADDYLTKNELCDWIKANDTYLRTKAAQLAAVDRWIREGHVEYTKDIKKRHIQHQGGCRSARAKS